MATQPLELETRQEERDEMEEDEEGEDVEEGWDDWDSDGKEAGAAAELLCLFCSSRFETASSLFVHCDLEHSFGFYKIVRDLSLDFYGCIKLINFIRYKVGENICWRCSQIFPCNKGLLNHLSRGESFNLEGKAPWEDDSYLKPFMDDDSLLHSFYIHDDGDECSTSTEKGGHPAGVENLAELPDKSLDTIIDCTSEINAQFKNAVNIRGSVEECQGSLSHEHNDRQLKIARANVSAREIKSVDDNYFGSYSSYSIHREMLSDKVRTDAYRDALLGNPSLMNGAMVLDVGCGTGILSLLAAKAGASRVVAVDASAKMASVASQIAKDNGLLTEEKVRHEQKQSSQVITVVHCEAEKLNKKIEVPPGGFDVLVSEWMGYCLLYESMLSSVLHARDHFLKPGGVILPDTATILGAGFGKGGTSLPFWENVYGFDMSCIGREVVEDAARFPIVDIVASHDIVTDAAVVYSFDLATMKESEMDFTASFELKPKANDHCGVTWCYGVVLWFETGFTSRFCKERQVVLSTSPLCPATHWSQTIFTFREPIAMAKDEAVSTSSSAPVGSDERPAAAVRSRVSIARASEHRSIDISVEITGISSDGRERSWPPQIFNL